MLKERLKRSSLVRTLNFKMQKKYLPIFIQMKQISDVLLENNVKFYYFEPPKAYLIRHLTPFEKERIYHWTFDFNHIEKDTDRLKKIYGDLFSEDYIAKIYDGAKVVSFQEEKKLVDFENEYVHICNGIRFTTDQPSQASFKIHLYGACTIRGTGVEDRHTVASYLQRMINEQFPDSYQVINHGIGCGSTIKDDLKQIEKTIFTGGDIVILCNSLSDCAANYCKAVGLPYYETSTCFQGPHSFGEWFTDDPSHTNWIGNEQIASRMVDILTAEIKEIPTQKTTVFTLQQLKQSEQIESPSEELKEYLATLKKLPIQKGTVGAIVMNCNPFTLGHRYLIEQAQRETDQLIIFVVEEDKSYFPFIERLELVKAGVSDLPNVMVVPSGKFIISALTFPGYFYKDQDKNAMIDASADIDLFGKYIAPALNITKRFAGEEPLDLVTRQYNQTMQERLPLYNITFVEIPRKRDEEEVISASRVRKLLETKDFGQIRLLVPDTTYQYLLKRFSND